MSEQALESSLQASLLPLLRGSGRERFAVGLWFLAQAFGWAEVRRAIPQGSLFRQLKILASVGLPVPHKWRAGPFVPSGQSGGWFGAQTAAEAVWAVTGDPGRIVTLPGTRFRVVRAWEPELSPVRTTGRVDRVLFGGAAWAVGFDFEGIPRCQPRRAKRRLVVRDRRRRGCVAGIATDRERCRAHKERIRHAVKSLWES